MKSEKEYFIFEGINSDAQMNDGSCSSVFSNSQIFDSRLPENNALLPFGSCFVHHSGKQFTCMAEHCLNHNCFRNELLTENADYQALYFYPKDRKVWCERIYPDIIRFIDTIGVIGLQEYRFSFNHRYIRKDGSVSQFLHEGFLAAKNNQGQSILTLNVFTELGDIKTDETIVLSIFRYSADWGYQKVLNKVYSNTRNSLLSQREVEIIRLCQEGLSSKLIADKLNLSIHTVKNHKRNSMEKTLTHNITELIHLCIQNYWL